MTVRIEIGMSKEIYHESDTNRWCIEWKDAKKEYPKNKGHYICWCPSVPPQSHPLQVVKWDNGWMTSWEVTRWDHIPIFIFDLR
jgi:hypothetical protein